MVSRHKDYIKVLAGKPQALVPLEDFRSDVSRLEINDNAGWKSLIHTYYLDDREKSIFNALSAAVLCGRKQRELSVLLGQHQPNLCVRMHWLARKLARLKHYLSSESFFEEYDLAKAYITKKQYMILGFYVAGNSLESIASAIGVSYVNITLLRSRFTDALTTRREDIEQRTKSGPLKVLPSFLLEAKYNFKYPVGAEHVEH